MPTDRKVEEVESLRGLLETCTSAVAADPTGLKVQSMTALRKALGQRGVRFRVVKNNLFYLAAEAAGRPALKEIVQGPTGIAFGFDDPVEPAKALTEFVISNRSAMAIKGGVLGDHILTTPEVAALAALPSKEQLVARLLGQLQGPITGLAYVLSAPVASLARVLQRHAEAVGEGAGE